MFRLDLNEKVFFIHSNAIKKGEITARYYRDNLTCDPVVSYAVKTTVDCITVKEPDIYKDIEQALMRI